MNYNSKTKMYEGYIYKISNDFNNSVYIGQTYTTVGVRWSGHKQQVKKHQYTDYLHNSMEIHGVEHFKIEVIEKVSEKDIETFLNILDDKEIFYIDLYDSYYNGYNSTKGGRHGVDHQKRSVAKYSLDGELLQVYESVDYLKTEFDTVSSIYACCYGECKYAYGYIWRYTGDDLYDFPLPNDSEKREATIRCLSLLPVDKYDYKGNKIFTYKNVKEAMQFENATRSKIVGCCNGRYVYHNMYVFRFHTDSFESYKTTTDKPKVVEQYDLQGNFVGVYESAREAGRINKIAYQSIVAVCNGKQKTAYGYIWKYIIDN